MASKITRWLLSLARLDLKEKSGEARGWSLGRERLKEASCLAAGGCPEARTTSRSGRRLLGRDEPHGPTEEAHGQPGLTACPRTLAFPELQESYWKALAEEGLADRSNTVPLLEVSRIMRRRI